ncbi:DoxX family protein [Pedobacter sp. UBA5917]|uniref:DoxX family protein n=1 Tax=Pedobacter sp. UBA5917 TaxID=1947061 RepID=UPI0025F67EA9|nr:DoxX family protein [Pedobacter sp. UBA5917]
MKALINKITTTENQVTSLILRITLFIVLWPHGAQLLLGLFGGYGYTGSMGYFTQSGLPYIVGFLVIFLLFFGTIAMLAGFLTRPFAAAFLIMFIGMITTVHMPFGFFMNWFGSQKGEGIEYHLLLIGIVIALMVTGGGKRSVDALISTK